MNNHKSAIEILSDEYLDIRKLMYKIAQDNPGALVSAAEELGIYKSETALVKMARQQPNGIVGAIKFVRGETGMGLKEARDWVVANNAYTDGENQ